MKNVLFGILSIFLGIIVIIIFLKNSKERVEYRGIAGGVMLIALGVSLLFGMLHL